ncbi:MAG: DegT/DnrJ/EryC1/StrS family aminotransferase [Thaumarchaeota archaeon]|nr:MAG: DegT/DnrJ/EryC1/StrS family aminotransferase [Nitrososphaerota archaeon]
MKKIKLFDPFIGRDEENSLHRVLKSKFWASGAGIGKVQEFEEKFNKYVGSDSCVAVNNGTAALHLALSLFDIRNKEVILPSLSFVSTAHSILYNGGKPIFVDVDPKTLCLDPELIEKSITKRTKIILPVHFGGMPYELNKIISLCTRYDIVMVEDAAHATGASYKNKKIGRHGDAVCFSFHPVKNLAMPTGGAITLNNKHSKNNNLTLKIRRWCGIANRKGSKYDVVDLGWNYYMNEFSAAIGLAQLRKLEMMNSKRRKIAKTYYEEIEVKSKMPFNKECCYHLYWIRVKNRDLFMKKMQENGIETGIHYFPIHQMKFYKGTSKLPITEEVGRSVVSIPNHPNLTEEDVDRIILLVNRFGS